MKKFREFLQLFFIVLGSMAFLLIAGTAGASDLNNITYEEVKARMIVALSVFILSVLIVKKLGKRKEEDYE